MDCKNLGINCEDENYMRAALCEAQKAAGLDEVPVGAVIVRNGEIIARTHNLVEMNKSSGAHAEMLAIRAAEKALNAKWLMGCTLYVTLEPCFMCAGSMVLARMDRLVIGAMDPKNGACGSLCNVVCDERLNHQMEVTTGVLGEECGELLRTFFRSKRQDKDALKRKRLEQLEEED